MKNTNRIRSKSTAKAASKQVKTQSSKAGEGADKISLIFFSEQQGIEIAGIDLSPAEWDAIKKDAAAHGEDLSAWFCRIVENCFPNQRTIEAFVKGGAR